MGRNDLCFCNSGRKKKKCHPDIHEESQAAEKLKIYGQFEEEFNNHNELTEGISLCASGCTDCCFDYFTVQNIEFDLILDELSKWDEERLKNFIKRVEKYWKGLVSEHPEVEKFTEKISSAEIDEINTRVEKSSLPCVFLDEDAGLCQIYNVRPFKCRIFGTTYYCDEEKKEYAIACKKYERIVNEENFDIFFLDVSEILDKNTDLAIIEDKNKNISLVDPEYPLIYNLYNHFIIKKLGTSIENYDEKFNLARSNYYKNIIKTKTK